MLGLSFLFAFDSVTAFLKTGRSHESRNIVFDVMRGCFEMN